MSLYTNTIVSKEVPEFRLLADNTFYLPLKYRLLRCFILFDDVLEHFSMLISANLIEICIMYFHAHIILSQGICMYYM